MIRNTNKKQQNPLQSHLIITCNDYMKCLTGVRTYIQDNGTDMATLNVLQRVENDCVVKKCQASNKQAKITDYFAC